MSIDDFLTRLRALDDGAQQYFVPELDPQSYIDRLKNFRSTFYIAEYEAGQWLDPRWASHRLSTVLNASTLPEWLDKAIADTQRESEIRINTALAVLSWLASRGHEVFGPAPDGRVFARVADAIQAEASRVAVLTVAEVAKQKHADHSTVRRWCKSNGFDKGRNGWQIPAGKAEAWRPRARTAKKKPRLRDLSRKCVWECPHCNHTVESDHRPAKCEKCNRSAFTRQSRK